MSLRGGTGARQLLSSPQPLGYSLSELLKPA